MVDQDIVEKYQSNLLQGSDSDASQRGLLMPSYAPLQSRLSGYMTYQEKTKYKEVDLPAFDLGDFHMSVLNDRGPEPLTIDDIPRDSKYIRNTVMNLREHGQLGKVEPFLNEVQLYETQQDYRGTENIPTDRLRAEMFLSKTDYYKATLFVDDIGNSRTEQVNDFERRELIWDQQEQARKRTILFDNETINYNTLAGALNPRNKKEAISQAIQKYSAISDQNTQDQKYQIKLRPQNEVTDNILNYQTVLGQKTQDQKSQFKVKTYNEIHDENINFQSTPDHQIPVADYSQVFITNAGSMPLNYLYAFSKKSERDREVFLQQQDEFNSLQKQQIIQYIRTNGVPKSMKSAIQHQQQDQSKKESILGRILGKLKGTPNTRKNRRTGEKEDKQIAQNFELLINVKRVKKDLCNAYYNRLQCVEDQMKVLNLDSNLIYKMPHQVDQKSMAELQVIEDFLIIAREAPKQQKFLLPKDNKYMQSQSFFEHCLNQLAEKYLANQKQLPKHLIKQINDQQVQTQQFGRESFQGNKTQLQSRLKTILSQFAPQNQQTIKEQKRQIFLQQKTPNFAKDRVNYLANSHFFSRQQDVELLRTLKNPTYLSHKKYSDLNPNSLSFNEKTGKIETISENGVNRGFQEGQVHTSRVPLNTNQNVRFTQNRELNNYERMEGQ